MQKPLAERVKALMGGNARLSTVTDTIAEIDAVIGDLAKQAEQAEARAVSPNVSDDEADAASDEAAKLARRIARLASQKTALESRQAELMDSDRRQRAIADHAAAKARRDALVQTLRDEVPSMLTRLAALFGEIQESEAECARVNQGASGYGMERLESAEAMARNAPSNFYVGPSPLTRLTKMTLPIFDASQGVGNVWPVAFNPLAKTMDAERTARARMAAEQKAEAKRWARYSVTLDAGSQPTMVQARNGMTAIYPCQMQELTMTVEAVEEARKSGCTIKALKPNEFVGLPTQSPELMA